METIIDQSDLLFPGNAKTGMSGDCRSCRQSELAYLSHFVGCYRPSLQIASLQHYPMYILEDGHQRLGISFFSPQMTERNVCATASTEISNLHESWLVLADDSPRGHESRLASFISAYDPAFGFDSIFLFDYLKSTIQIIK